VTADDRSTIDTAQLIRHSRRAIIASCPGCEPLGIHRTVTLDQAEGAAHIAHPGGGQLERRTSPRERECRPRRGLFVHRRKPHVFGPPGVRYQLGSPSSPDRRRSEGAVCGPASGEDHNSDLGVNGPGDIHGRRVFLPHHGRASTTVKRKVLVPVDGLGIPPQNRASGSGEASRATHWSTPRC
jgi:hypothetical protein